MTEGKVGTIGNAAVSGMETISRTTQIDYGGWPMPFDDSGVQYAWDSVSLGLLKTCPRKYQLSIVLNWQPKIRSYHLDFGIYYHTAIEHFLKYKAARPEEATADFDTLHEDAVRSAIKRAMIDSFGFAGGMKKGVPDNAKTRETLIRVLVWYFEHYKHDNCRTVMLSNGKPAVELSFRFGIGDHLMLAGHLDEIVQFGDDPKELYVMDHKTTGSTITGASARYFFKNFKPDNQMTLYSLGAAVAFATPVKGVIIDAAQMMVGGHEFARSFTHRSGAELDEFIQSVYMYRRMAELYHKQGFFPMNETACGNYGGCQYRDICSKSPQVRERFLRTEFTQEKPWNPLEPR
jgi:hypothetical protein